MTVQFVEPDPKDSKEWASLYILSLEFERIAVKFFGERKLNRHRSGSGSTSAVEPDPRILKSSTM